MSLRDWFAGQVLVGLLGKLPLIDQSGEFGAKVEDKVAYNLDVADSCYQIADAMLRAREREQEGADDDAWALHAAVTIHPTIGTESIHQTTWTARHWDGVRTLEESGPTIAAAIRALRAKVEGGAR